jgi:hypothetical protein
MILSLILNLYRQHVIGVGSKDVGYIGVKNESI